MYGTISGDSTPPNCDWDETTPLAMVSENALLTDVYVDGEVLILLGTCAVGRMTSVLRNEVKVRMSVDNSSVKEGRGDCGEEVVGRS